MLIATEDPSNEQHRPRKLQRRKARAVSGPSRRAEVFHRDVVRPYGDLELKNVEDRTPLAARGLNVRAALRSGGFLTNDEFDELYPPDIRAKSQVYWTPLEIAVRTAKMLVDAPGCRVLDVGSGAGKFCVVGSLVTEGEFVGVEQQAPLVECARELASVVGATNATFFHGAFDTLNPEDFDAFYFFNPFEENKFVDPTDPDANILLLEERFRTDVRNAQRFLRRARKGARVLTYNGMGGRIPRCYSLLDRIEMRCTVELWVHEAQ